MLSIDAWSDALLVGQGREAEVVVFSTVRRNPHGSIGFVSDERRLNVAITRPRRWIPPSSVPSLHHRLLLMTVKQQTVGAVHPCKSCLLSSL